MSKLSEVMKQKLTIEFNSRPRRDREQLAMKYGLTRDQLYKIVCHVNGRKAFNRRLALQQATANAP